MHLYSKQSAHILHELYSSLGKAKENENCAIKIDSWAGKFQIEAK